MRRPLSSLLLSAVFFASVVPAAWAKTPDDTFYSRQWYLQKIGAEQAWDVTTGSRDVIVAVVDTAMDIDHEDLMDNIWKNEKEIPGNQLDDDGNGMIDDVNGWNFLNNTNDVRAKDPGAGHRGDQGYVHATLVASLIGASGNNGKGISGLAWSVRIMPVVAIDADGGGSTADVAKAIRYAANNGAVIINLSLEGYLDAPDVDDAIAYARSRGALTIAAAGNSDKYEGINVDDKQVYPVCLSSDVAYGLLGVGSTDQSDMRAPFANYGSCVQISAPGNDVYGARPASNINVPGYEGGFSGTSLAVPLAAGTAALIKSLRPDWGWAEIRERIMASAVPIDHLQDAGYRGRIGRGRLDVAAAISGVPRLPAAVPSSELVATPPGKPTRVRIRTGGKTIEIVPFGSTDTRGARAAFTDLNGDGSFEIAVVPASGKIAEWSTFSASGTVMTHGVLARDIRDGVIVARANDGFVVADANGGRAWGVNAAGTVNLFMPYGAAYRAGLDVVSVPGGVAFAPRGGGGHLMVMDRTGKRLVSAFPFGKSARGRWSLGRIGGQQGVPASLVMSGPPGSVFLEVSRLDAEGWLPLGLSALEKARPMGSSGLSSSVPGEMLYDGWPRSSL